MVFFGFLSVCWVLKLSGVWCSRRLDARIVDLMMAFSMRGVIKKYDE